MEQSIPCQCPSYSSTRVELFGVVDVNSQLQCTLCEVQSACTHLATACPEWANAISQCRAGIVAIVSQKI